MCFESPEVPFRNNLSAKDLTGYSGEWWWWCTVVRFKRIFVSYFAYRYL